MKLNSIIGLEIHVQLKTKSKMFCACKNELNLENPNINTCPICLGHPGTLPTLNKQALDFGIKVALALNCEVPSMSKFDRKNYFYPDLPKGYQISQYDHPIGKRGHLIIVNGDKRVRIGINRVHLEEDAAKLVHSSDKSSSLVDFNRGGTPLIEIVTEPHIHSPEEAKLFLQELKKIMRYIGVSDADMEKGHLRCDANISLQPKDDGNLYPKIEVKNVNSFRSAEKALAFEIQRQTKLWEAGNKPEKQETRRWNDVRNITEEQRSKEEASDYRYFPEPDIPPLHLKADYISSIQSTLPELPDPKRERFIKEYGLTREEALVVTADRGVADYFEDAISEANGWIKSKEDKEEIDVAKKEKMTRLIFNWITTELFKLMKEHSVEISNVKVTPENLAELVSMLIEQEINSSAGQTIMLEMFLKGSDPSQVADSMNLRQVSDAKALESIVVKVLAGNNKAVSEFKKGKANALQFIIGQVMKETKGTANPEVAKKIIESKISTH